LVSFLFCHLLQLRGRIACEQIVDAILELLEDLLDLLLGTIFDHLLGASLVDSSKNLQKEFVFRLLNVDLEFIDVEFDLRQLGVGCVVLHIEVELELKGGASVTCDVDIGDTLVRQLGECLPVELEVDVADLELDVRHGDLGTITSLLGSEVAHVDFGVRSGVHLDHVGEDLFSVENHVVEVVVVIITGTFDRWDGNVLELGDQQRHDELAQLLDEIPVEALVALFVGVCEVIQEVRGLLLQVAQVGIVFDRIDHVPQLAHD